MISWDINEVYYGEHIYRIEEYFGKRLALIRPEHVEVNKDILDTVNTVYRMTVESINEKHGTVPIYALAKKPYFKDYISIRDYYVIPVYFWYQDSGSHILKSNRCYLRTIAQGDEYMIQFWDGEQHNYFAGSDSNELIEVYSKLLVELDK